MHNFFSLYTGTKSYWRARLCELLDMEKQLGLPTLFFTLSAADLHWPELMKVFHPDLTQHEISNLSERERRELVATKPIVPSSVFYERAEYFLDKILHPKFQVLDFWRRYEWQHRGSPHVHMLLWIDKAPDVTKFLEMTEEEQREVIQ
jgi:hypothetical protein